MIQVVVNMVNWHSHINPSQIIQKVQIVCACLYSKGTLLKPNKFQPIFDLMNFKSSWTLASTLFLFPLERTYVILTLNLCRSGKILVDKVHRSPILPFRVLDWPKDTDTDVSSCDNIYIKLQFLKRFIPNEQRA